jgi:hypothetical protein
LLCDCPGDLVDGVAGRHPGADVEELADSGVGDQAADRAAGEGPQLAGRVLQTGKAVQGVLAVLPVGRVRPPSG